MAALVSILIPAYNAEQWIRHTVSSALDQTWPRKEIIIVDDGSRDGTLALARAFEQASVKVVTQENRGAAAARNRALGLAQGDYIQWLDADDLLAPDKIERQMRMAEAGSERVLLSGGFATFYFRPEAAAFIPNPLWRDLTPKDWLVTRFRDNVWMHPAGWLVSRMLTEAAGPWDERLSLNDDGEYFCRTVSRSSMVRFAAEAKCYYRIGTIGSLSWGISDKAAESLFLSIALCIGHLRSLDTGPATRAACVQFLQHALRNFYPEKQALLVKANALARDLGGSLSGPAESRMFSLLRRMVGWRVAKRIKDLEWKAETIVRKQHDRVLQFLSRNHE